MTVVNGVFEKGSYRIDMAGKGKSRERIEPSFGRDGDRDDESDFSVQADDRVVAGRSRSKGSAAEPRMRQPSRRERRSSREGGSFRLLRRMIYWCIVLAIWGAIGVTGLVAYYGSRMPSASSWQIPARPPNVKVVSVDGTVIANRGATGGEALALEDMSPYLPEAIVAIEDRRFYSHWGIDPMGLGRAFVTNITTGHMVQGGSTLTQQLAKNLFLSPERTVERKVQEVLLAVWLEHNYSKEQILNMYLNRVFFGSNAYGVEAASRRYFNKSARDVTLGEAALLAGLVKAPSRLSPARDPAAANARAQVVLQAMRDQGMITEDEAKTAMSQPATKAKSYWSGAGQYVADMVMDELTGLIGPVKEDVIVDTTIDKGLEKKAEQALNAVLAKEGAKQGASQAALVSLDGTGAIRALVGGRDYAASQFNRAVKAKRQPGSSFKPFVYAAALEKGLSPFSVFNDGPIRIGDWTPENYEKKYSGDVTLATAFARSLNTVAAQLVMYDGPDQVVKFAHRLGIDSDLQPNASIALGTSEVSLAELTGAYAAFMNGGFKATPHIIRRVTTPDGRVLYDNKDGDQPRVLSEKIAVDMNAMMLGVIEQGTGRSARIPGWQAAGKTGTTQNFRDALFVGFTSNLTTGVWFGNDDGHPMKKVTGGGLPAKAWQDFMIAAHKGLSPTPLFGGGQFVPDQAPPPEADQPMASADPRDWKPSTITDIISGVFGETQDAPLRTYPAAPARAEPVQPEFAGDGEEGPVPPGDVGEAEPAPQARRTTLLDVLMGR